MYIVFILFVSVLFANSFYNFLSESLANDLLIVLIAVILLYFVLKEAIVTAIKETRK